MCLFRLKKKRKGPVHISLLMGKRLLKTVKQGLNCSFVGLGENNERNLSTLQ